jgi:hypothetical protein
MLNDRQLRILRVIDAGNTTGEALAEVLGSSMQMLSHYLNTLAEAGYLKAAKAYDNQLQDFVVVRAYLTAEGKAILQSQPTLEAQPEAPAVAASDADAVPSTATLAPPRQSAAGLDVIGILASLGQIRPLLVVLPERWRDVIEVYVDDLQDEIKLVNRRRFVRIKAYFLALLRTVLPIVARIPNGTEWVAVLRRLSEQLGIPVKLPDN